MSSARDDIALAVNRAGFVNITSHYRQSLRPGDGFVKWSGQQRSANGLGFVDTWQVWIALPQDVKAAEQWLEEHLAELVTALDTELVVTGSQPAELVLGDSTNNGLILEGTRPAA